MNLERLLRLFIVLQIIRFSQSSHVQQAKQRIRADVRNVFGQTGGNWAATSPQLKQHHHHHNHQRKQHHWHNEQREQRLASHQQRWSRGRSKSLEQHHHFTAWTAWSRCGSDCVKRRERYCMVNRKCGHIKQLEEQKCWGCQTALGWNDIMSAHKDAAQTTHHHSSNSPAIIINAPHTGLQPLWTTQAPLLAPHVRLSVLQEIESHPRKHVNPSVEHKHATTDADISDYYIIKSKPRYKKRRKPIYIDVDDYTDLETEDEDEELIELEMDQKTSYADPVHSIRMSNQRRLKGRKKQKKQQQQRAPAQRHSYDQVTQRNLAADDSGIEGDTFQYEDFDSDHDTAARGMNAAVNYEQYNDSYEDADYGDYRNLSVVKERATPEAFIPQHRRIYSKWSRWTKCSPKCTTRRYKKCRIKEQCGREVLREIAYCYTEGSFCQQWLAAQVQKTPPFELRPAVNRRRDISAANGPQLYAITNDYIMNGKGYRGPEYVPMKLKCGIPPIRSNRRNMYNMLKIIGGKAARKGEWPWQVAIFNRFKEAFCGGTLIAPEWVITAAHCVRKVLYVRLGEHNLDYEDGTELQLRVLRSYKHPNFDKKTVDSDVALLKLPRAANISTWIGYSCLPRPYQPLPKNMDCTVIGWGKRRNRDVAGTSVLHQAEVPIIPMDNCRSVYHDYTITKNMFCAGHRRGRIDTCAGDSGGPLLCRDTTKPNHPWTIFGITSFGDGCAKRNKFGIYAKVPNYVDWVWSVINCNGNCKLHHSSYGN